ncbi:MAG: 50S ribosomal protein L22 [Oscillospiraceae bacterium]|nr:50S ribosomal protein L22 [Oscillospiraceae bacterium]
MNRRRAATPSAEATASSAFAIARYIRISPSKVRIVADLIRGKSAAQAQAILQFTPKAASPYLLKVLNSAIANAENNFGLALDELVVLEAYANSGPTLKRFVARSRGSASPILKRTSHIGVVVGRKVEKEYTGRRRSDGTKG